jgi:hypothetical protein
MDCLSAFLNEKIVGLHFKDTGSEFQSNDPECFILDFRRVVLLPYLWMSCDCLVK